MNGPLLVDCSFPNSLFSVRAEDWQDFSSMISFYTKVEQFTLDLSSYPLFTEMAT